MIQCHSFLWGIRSVLEGWSRTIPEIGVSVTGDLGFPQGTADVFSGAPEGVYMPTPKCDQHALVHA